MITGVAVTYSAGVAVGVRVGVDEGVTGVLVGIGWAVAEGVGVLRSGTGEFTDGEVAADLVKVGGTSGDTGGMAAAAANVGSGSRSSWQPLKKAAATSMNATKLAATKLDLPIEI